MSRASPLAHLAKAGIPHCQGHCVPPNFFITFFSYAHHRHASQSLRRYLDSRLSRTAFSLQRRTRFRSQTFHVLFDNKLRQMAPVSTPASARQTVKFNAKSNILNTLPLTILLSST